MTAIDGTHTTQGCSVPSFHGMSEIFGPAVPTAIFVKEAIGEMAAAGGAQIVAACRALADPEAPFPTGAAPRRVLVNSFGAGGNFFAAIFESAG